MDKSLQKITKFFTDSKVGKDAFATEEQYACVHPIILELPQLDKLAKLGVEGLKDYKGILTAKEVDKVDKLFRDNVDIKCFPQIYLRRKRNNVKHMLAAVSRVCKEIWKTNGKEECTMEKAIKWSKQNPDSPETAYFNPDDKDMLIKFSDGSKNSYKIIGKDKNDSTVFYVDNKNEYAEQVR